MFAPKLALPECFPSRLTTEGSHTFQAVFCTDTHCRVTICTFHNAAGLWVIACPACTGVSVKTPATDREVANSWMLWKRKTRLGEGHTTHVAKRCTTHSHLRGQTRDGMDGVMVAKCELQHSAQEKIRNSATTHMDGPRRGLVPDGGCGWCHGWREVGLWRDSLFSARRVRMSQFDWLLSPTHTRTTPPGLATRVCAQRSVKRRDRFQARPPERQTRRHRVGISLLSRLGSSTLFS